MDGDDLFVVCFHTWMTKCIYCNKFIQIWIVFEYAKIKNTWWLFVVIGRADCTFKNLQPFPEPAGPHRARRWLYLHVYPCLPCVVRISNLLYSAILGLLIVAHENTAVSEWISSWLVEQEVRGSIPRLATWISDIGYLLLPSRDMAEIPLNTTKQYTRGPSQNTLNLDVK